MDMKGMSWVGNFYQKFEAMCLEVEEIMYQDTVKYVENQMQTVGSSVKKFYSDVMQDLLPPSSMEAAKVGDSNLRLDFYGDVGIYTKPKMGMKEKNAKTFDIKKVTEDEKKATDCHSDYDLAFQRSSHVDNLFLLSQKDFTGGASRQNMEGRLSNKSNLRSRKSLKRASSSLNEKSRSITGLDVDMNRISLFSEPSSENHLGNSTPLASRQNVERHFSRKSNKQLGIDTPFLKDLTGASPACVFSNDNHNSFHQEAKTTTPRFSEETGTGVIEESQNETEIVTEQIADISSDEQSSDMVRFDEYGTSEEMDMRASSGSVSLVEGNAANSCTNDGVNSLVDSCANWQVRSNEVAPGEDFLFNSGSSDGWNAKGNEVDTSFLSEMEVIQQVDEAKLEESCIVVNSDDLHFVRCCEGKSKCYQKKILDVFTPRRGSARKHEYEQLAQWPIRDPNLKKEECDRNATLSRGKRSSTADICEAEWELL